MISRPRAICPLPLRHLCASQIRQKQTIGVLPGELAQSRVKRAFCKVLAAVLGNQLLLFQLLVCTAGAVHFAPLAEFSVEQYAIGLQSKLMEQVNLVRSGVKYLRGGGSFTLTSGPTNEDPIPLGTSSAMVNGALEGLSEAWRSNFAGIAASTWQARPCSRNHLRSTVLTSWVRKPWRRTT